MTATVYIIGWNGDRWLPACIENLHRASAQRVHLVLIDNHNNPGIPELPLERFETRVVKTPRKMGFADAHNFGIVAAPPETDLVVLLNQDTKSMDGWIDRCAACFATEARLGIVMPGLRTYDDDAWDSNYEECARENPDLLRVMGEEPSPKGTSEGRASFAVPTVTGAAMVIRPEVLWEVGLFDPIFESYYEDFDFCRRAARAGWGVAICPGARVRHFQGSATDSPEARRRQERWIVRNRVIQEVRAAGDRRVAVVLKQFLLRFPRNLARGVVRTPSSQSIRATVGAHADLLRLIPRLTSRLRDDARWEASLRDIRWPGLQAGSAPE